MSIQITKRTSDLKPYDAAKGAGAIHALEAMQKIAERIKDADALERALIAKLTAQREFAESYQAQFPHGQNRYTTRDDSTVISSSAMSKREDYCKYFGFQLRSVQRWAERLIDPAKFETEKERIIKKCKQLTEMWQSAFYSSESSEWYTPEKYIESARAALGGIDLDPASCEFANKVVKATGFWTAADKPLERDWHGRVFMNPPYGKAEDGSSIANAFCTKALAEYDTGNTEATIILINSLHDQNWQAPLYDGLVCFVDHRIRFMDADGDSNTSPTFQNIFVYLGRKPEHFVHEFEDHGYVMKRVAGRL